MHYFGSSTKWPSVSSMSNFYKIQWSQSATFAWRNGKKMEGTHSTSVKGLENGWKILKYSRRRFGMKATVHNLTCCRVVIHRSRYRGRSSRCTTRSPSWTPSASSSLWPASLRWERSLWIWSLWAHPPPRAPPERSPPSPNETLQGWAVWSAPFSLRALRDQTSTSQQQMNRASVFYIAQPLQHIKKVDKSHR